MDRTCALSIERGRQKQAHVCGMDRCCTLSQDGLVLLYCLYKTVPRTIFFSKCVNALRLSHKTPQKSQQHPKDFPGGHPPQYYPGLAPLNFGVQMGSGAFDAVWPLARALLAYLVRTQYWSLLFRRTPGVFALSIHRKESIKTSPCLWHGPVLYLKPRWLGTTILSV